ncbi:MAG: hypothetical protein ACJ75J_13265 [Cytophagaceae bacterium]
MAIRIRENSFPAWLAGRVLQSKKTAMVIGKTIHLTGVNREEFLQDKKWVAHEMAHVRQFRKYGFIRFIYMYLLESIKKGYHQNRFEAEAREAENKV